MYNSARSFYRHMIDISKKEANNKEIRRSKHFLPQKTKKKKEQYQQKLPLWKSFFVRLRPICRRREYEFSFLSV